MALKTRATPYAAEQRKMDVGIREGILELVHNVDKAVMVLIQAHIPTTLGDIKCSRISVE